jgi:hypothetical protein
VDREQTPQERARELVRLLVPDWRPTTRQALWVIRIAIVLGVLITIGYSYGITLWDWAKLLIVPAVLAAGGVWFNQQQRERELQIAEQRAQDEALQGYLEQISHLLTDKERPLRRAKPGDDLSTVARARTLTVLPRLDRERKRSVMQFLYESGLIYKDSLVLDMSEADLRGAYLIGANLSETNLSETYLSGANLIGAALAGANLIGANLIEADLSGADLIETYLSGGRP